MAITTPKINRIYKVTEFDLMSSRTAKVPGNMYICLDSLKMYYDETKVKRVIYNYVGVKTINDLRYNITPSKGTTYYCWEDNSLWLWMDKWITLYTDSTYPSAYVYDDNNILSDVYRNDSFPLLADDNGLLKDGSVVVRDRNRIIKGKLYINDGNDNLTISSYLGGAVRILPNGKMDTDGELLIGDEGSSFLRSEWNVRNNEMYVDYSEAPELDNSKFEKPDHRYMVFHEGNLDASAVHEITPIEILTKLQDKSLPTPLNLNVMKVGNKSINEISLVGHKHIASDITDFNQKARAQAELELKTIMNSAIGRGIDIEFNDTTKALKLTAKSFNLAFSGGVSGAKLVDTLTDTTISLTVDPNKHIHQNYIDRMDNIQTQLNSINAMDPADYYTKVQTDAQIAQLAGTATPTVGKPLLVNSSLKLPATATAADKLSATRTIQFQGDITGTLSTDFSGNQNVQLNASNILSNVPTPGKALKVNSNGDLPGNAESATALNHTIQVNLLKDVVGTGTLDTSKNKMDINCTLVPGDNILQTKDINVSVAGIDKTTGKIPENLLPQLGGLTPKGKFDPSAGLPSTNPKEGDFWIANGTGTINGETYNTGDWIVYIDGDWMKVSTLNSVSSVNGKTGNVTLNANDVGAISKDLINYTPGVTIPNGYIVKTSSAGKITGASIEKLNNKFSVNSDTNSEIEIASNSTNKSTDGSQNLGLNLKLTTAGYNAILNNAAHDIQDHGTILTHKRYINFGDGFTIDNTSSNGITITTNSGSANIIEWDGEPSTNNPNNIQLWQNVLDSEDASIVLVSGNDYTRVGVIPITPNIGKYFKDNSITGTKDFYFMECLDTTSIDFTLNTSSGIYTVLRRRYCRLTFTNGIITGVSGITANANASPKYLPTDNNSVTNYAPTYDYHPATKKYVDDHATKCYSTVIGDGTAKSFNVTHNLNSMNVIVQCRIDSTGEQIFVKNSILSNNIVQIEFNQAPAKDSIQVIIK